MSGELNSIYSININIHSTNDIQISTLTQNKEDYIFKEETQLDI